MINNRTCNVFGYHRKKAEERGDMWQIHYIGGGKSLVADTSTTFEHAKGKAREIDYIENVSMREGMDLFLLAIRHRLYIELRMADDTYELSYRHGVYYIGERPVLELEVRRQIQIYYTLHHEEWEDDVAYIGEVAQANKWE
jgi:hypothetical protein